MPLPDLDDIKAYLHVQTTADDIVLDRLRVSAVALIESAIGRPILDPNGTRSFGAVRATYPKLAGLRVTDAALNNRPLTSGYDRFGRITNVPAATQVNGLVALSTLSDYAARWEPMVSQAVIDVVSELYNIRNPRVQTQNVGAGVSTTFERRVGGLPARVWAFLQPIRDLAA